MEHVETDLHEVEQAMATCPDCGGTELEVGTDLGAVVFRCRGCPSAWRYALGFVWRIDPTSVRARPSPDVPRPSRASGAVVPGSTIASTD